MPKPEESIITFTPSSVQDWRAWLEQNHLSQKSVWLILHKKDSGKPHISWSEAVDQALCFGWIDSTRKAIDHEKFKQFFSPRKAKGTWSKVNKLKVEELQKEGLMHPAGLESIEKAKQNGSWTLLDDVEDLIIPADLTKELKKYPGAEAYFLSLSKSVKKIQLYWIVSAQRPETRQKRIQELALKASNGKI